jgi:exodeoxyribonuclease VII large subunit
MTTKSAITTNPQSKRDFSFDTPKKTNGTRFSIQPITTRIKSLIEENVPDQWIHANVISRNEDSSGRLYFTLKDEQSQLNAVLFKADARVSALIKKDARIFVYGKFTVHESNGIYQMHVSDIASNREDQLKAEYYQIKKKLSDDGLLKKPRKKLPEAPKRIALITAEKTAGDIDINAILKRCEWPHEPPTIYHTSLNGESAAAEIRSNLYKAQNSDEAFDLIILTRGGGSFEDISVFNDEALVRSISTCHIPTISAVGHERDHPLSDDVADLRLETPSAAAAWLIETNNKLRSKKELLIEKQQWEDKLQLQTKRYKKLKTILVSVLLSLFIALATYIYYFYL